MGMQSLKLRLVHKPALFPLLILFAISIAACTKNTVLVKPNSPTAPNLKCDCATIKGAEKNTDIVVSEPKVLDNKGQDNKSAEAKPSDVKIADYGLLKPAKWEDIDGFNANNSALSNLTQDNLSLAWPAWMQSCSTLVNKPLWQKACNAASRHKILLQPLGYLARLGLHGSLFEGDGQPARLGLCDDVVIV